MAKIGLQVKGKHLELFNPCHISITACGMLKCTMLDILHMLQFLKNAKYI